MGMEKQAEGAVTVLRSRLSNPSFAFKHLSCKPDSNYSKLKFIISSSITEGCNNSILLLGPRGNGKISVLEQVLADLSVEHPDLVTAVRLNGLLHYEDNCAFKEIAQQLALDHQLSFSKMASSEDNYQFMVSILRGCGLAHKTIVFVLNEFELFAQGKQRVLYSLLDAMQTVKSQSVVIGVSCRLDADQLLEKRIRSRFSHRKLLFAPPTKEDLPSLLLHILSLPEDSSLPSSYISNFNRKLQNILADEKFERVLAAILDSETSVSHLLRFIFVAVSFLDMKSGFLSVDNFRAALSCIQRKPKQECIKDCSILELYMIVCMRRLEIKERNSYNFTSIMKEYKAVHDSFQISDYYAKDVCLRAFERLLQREVISFMDSRNNSLSIEFRPVKLLLSYMEIQEGLKSYRSCPVILQKLVDKAVEVGNLSTVSPCLP